MSEQQNPETPVVTDQQGQEPNPAVDPAAPVASGDADGKPAVDDPGADAAGDDRVKKANREAAKYRTELRKAQEQLEAIERERMTETEKATADAKKAQEAAQQLTQKAQAALGKAAVAAAAVEAKLVDPAIAYDLLASKLTFDADGEPENAVELVKQLAEAKPFLVNRSGANAGGAPGAAAPGVQPVREQDRGEFLKPFGLAR